MPFFQNPFVEEFQGVWVLGDRQHSPTFVCKPNAGRGPEIVSAWGTAPYNLSGNDSDGNAKATLKINYCLHATKNWATISVNVTAGASSAAAVTADEIVNALNASTLFSERFTAFIDSFDNSGRKVMIRQKKPRTEFKFYVVNGQAESVLGFNARAGVAELPTYFSRHSIANRFEYADSQNALVELDPGASNIDASIIDNAVDARGTSLGYDSGTVQSDWELLRGRSGLFQFTSGPSGQAAVPESTTTTIVYPAGARAGDLATKIVIEYDADDVQVAKYEMPYTLVDADLITPP